MRGRRFPAGANLFALVLAVPCVLAVPAAPAAAAECQDWVARTVSTQGRVETRRAGEPQWLPVRLGTAHCLGDAVRLGPLSRAALVLREGGVLRLDQNTTITFTPPAERAGTWVDLLTGAVHFFSRTPRGLRVTTPFVNGSVEGTEFLVEVDLIEARISVWEGRVLAENAQGSLALAPGQSAAARAGQPPTLRPIVVRPADAVAWALHYPPVLDLRPSDFPDRPGESWPALVRRSIEAAGRGDLASALAAVAGIPDTVPDARVFVHRAGLFLAVGRVDEALSDVDRALRLGPQSGDALALRSVVAVARNDPPAARALAEQAIQSDPGSAAAHLALSYARQAAFDLSGALASLQQAVQLQPGNALARARLAELWLSLGNLDRAREAAAEGARLDPGNARAQTVLGFTALTQIRRREAAEAFERAIELDPAAPLPRLGLGLTRIRGGDLEGGRQELEIAVSLDPGDSLLRSYLGKAYYEERQPVLASDQFKLAQDLDANDPTPWLYDAIRLQSVNRPVEALRSLERSIELNDNRAVYRSRLQLDEDRAARSASLARIYDDLGFQQRALVEGWLSVNADPASDSAHRFLADTYAVLPRHDTARVSELLQSQLLQPINVLPVQPQLGLNNSFILARAGPADPGFGEWNSLFTRNGIHVLASGLVGGNDTYGDQVVVSGIWDRLSVSVGQLHYETDGFRPNNDLEENVYQIFAQLQLSARTSVQVEYRRRENEQGDLPLRFDPNDFEPTLRQTFDSDSARIGLRQALTPSSLLVGSLIYEDDRTTLDIFGSHSRVDQSGYHPELQYLYRSPRFSLVGGAGYFTADGTDSALGDFETRHGNVYAYPQVHLPWNVDLTLGASVDVLSSSLRDTTQFNPKLGVIWNPVPETTFRAAAFRTLEKPLFSGRSIEPTQVAGFNQLFDDAGLGADSWRYGVAWDQRLPRSVYVGVEASRRDSTVPFDTFDLDTGIAGKAEADWREYLVRTYAYWAVTRQIALSVEYLYERLDREPENSGVARVVESDTHRVPLSLAFFHPLGFQARVTGTYVNQSGQFGDAFSGVESGSDQFWVLDASIGYRLPKRFGLITLEGRNLLDHRFHYNGPDFGSPPFYPERLILLRVTLAF
ncbi:MAG TPA: tetratricopeptide repeat protein [Methylomirabilota bacterium]|nr:tetratricopeptide repeat protein [Methylomirabilota bacterium]